MKLIVGLGNPGKQYTKTRHNIGFVILDHIRDALQEFGPSPWQLSKKFNAEISGCEVRGQKIILAKPMTFMNDSGIAVALIANFYKISPDDIVVVHDEKDLPLGSMKVQSDRGSAGHQGVNSIIKHIGTENFFRVRIGIANKNERAMRNVPAFVLGKFGIFERKKVEEIIKKSVDDILRPIRQRP